MFQTWLLEVVFRMSSSSSETKDCWVSIISHLKPLWRLLAMAVLNGVKELIWLDWSHWWRSTLTSQWPHKNSKIPSPYHHDQGQKVLLCKNAEKSRLYCFMTKDTCWGKCWEFICSTPGGCSKIATHYWSSSFLCSVIRSHVKGKWIQEVVFQLF